MGRLEKQIKRIAASQEKTDELIRALVLSQRKTDQQIAALNPQIAALNQQIAALTLSQAALVLSQHKTDQQLANLIGFNQRRDNDLEFKVEQALLNSLPTPTGSEVFDKSHRTFCSVDGSTQFEWDSVIISEIDEEPVVFVCETKQTADYLPPPDKVLMRVARTKCCAASVEDISALPSTLQGIITRQRMLSGKQIRPYVGTYIMPEALRMSYLTAGISVIQSSGHDFRVFAAFEPSGPAAAAHPSPVRDADPR
jgi:hypothetical protein